MMKGKVHSEGYTARRDKVTVALATTANSLIREEAIARGWRLVHLWHAGFPEGITPKGALVDYLLDNETVQDLLKDGVSVVRLGNLPHPDDAALPAVLPDHVAEGRMAADHFAERGFKDVGYVGSDPWSDFRLLFDGFRERAEALGMNCHLLRFKGREGETKDEVFERKEYEFCKWLQETPTPLGLLAAGSWRAATHCYWVTKAGLRVPDDVAVLSSGYKAEICEATMPTISSLDLNDDRRIRMACDLLDRMMKGEKAPLKPIMIPPKGVIERESTNLLATSDRVVAQALRYMWDNLDLNLSVEDVAAEVGKSSRQLARHFRQELGRTVTEELRRKRLEETKHLLLSTKLPLSELAPMVGFGSTSYLHRSFQKAFGMTPAQYRRRRS